MCYPEVYRGRESICDSRGLSEEGTLDRLDSAPNGHFRSEELAQTVRYSLPNLRRAALGPDSRYSVLETKLSPSRRFDSSAAEADSTVEYAGLRECQPCPLAG